MNIVCLIGRLTNKPVIRYTQSQIPVASFTLAVDNPFSKEGQADFISITAWNKTADFCDKYFGKGVRIGLTGRIQTRNWEDTEGKKHYITEVVAERVFFADAKKDGGKESEYSKDDIPSEFYTDDDENVPF
jgi:single-strand DNA-binding protein